MADCLPQGEPTSSRRPSNAPRRCVRQKETGLKHERHSCNKTTGRYNMNVLRELSRVEESALKELAGMYQVDSDDSIPVDFDIHQLLDLTEDERRPFLDDMLRDCPSDHVPAFIDTCLDRIKGLKPCF